MEILNEMPIILTKDQDFASEEHVAVPGGVLLLPEDAVLIRPQIIKVQPQVTELPDKKGVIVFAEEEESQRIVRQAEMKKEVLEKVPPKPKGRPKKEHPFRPPESIVPEHLRADKEDLTLVVPKRRGRPPREIVEPMVRKAPDPIPNVPIYPRRRPVCYACCHGEDRTATTERKV